MPIHTTNTTDKLLLLFLSIMTGITDMSSPVEKAKIMDLQNIGV